MLTSSCKLEQKNATLGSKFKMRWECMPVSLYQLSSEKLPSSRNMTGLSGVCEISLGNGVICHSFIYSVNENIENILLRYNTIAKSKLPQFYIFSERL